MGFFKLIFPLIFAIAGTLFLAIAYREGSKKYKINTEGIERQKADIFFYPDHNFSEQGRKLVKSIHLLVSVNPY